MTERLAAERRSATMTPTWFGPDAAPLFGWFHAPADRRARGVVVLCPPVGLEMPIAYRTMRILADRLVGAGIGVLRFAYATTGDSAGGSADPDRVARWLASVGDAVAYARAAGATRVVVAGMRLGATLAAVASSVGPQLDGLVLWDPCESGASFLREERTLFRVGVPASQRVAHPEGSVEAPGTLYPAEAVTALDRVHVGALLDATRTAGDAVVPQVGPVLLVTRAEVRARLGVQRLAAAEGVESIEGRGQSALFDGPELTVPVEALERIVEWVARLLPDARQELTPETRDEAVVARTSDGCAIRERFVRLGESGLFGIMTEIDGARDTSMILTNYASPAFRIGPARLWVDLARAWAAGGVSVLRFDDAGTGDSPGGDDAAVPGAYSAAAVRDVVTAVQTVRAAGAREVGLTGFCSAAWACLRAATQVHVESVILLNPAVWDVRPGPHLTQPRTTESDRERVPDRATLKSRVRGWARLAARRILPEPVWWRLARSGHIGAPAGMITPLALQGTRVRLLFGHREASAFRERRGDRLISRFGARGLVEAFEGEDIDHSLLSLQARDMVTARLSDWVGVQ